MFVFVLKSLADDSDFGLAYFQPKFICRQVAKVVRCFKIPPVLTRELVAEGLAKLYVQIESGTGASDTLKLSHQQPQVPQSVL